MRKQFIFVGRQKVQSAPNMELREANVFYLTKNIFLKKPIFANYHLQ
jgi:hypothetical protein